MGYASGQTNFYSFVGDGPTNATDPTGLLSDDEFENRDGLARAIQKKTLVAETSLEGKTFGNDKVTFTLKKAYRGSFESKYSTFRLKGMYVKWEATSKCDYDEIRLIQVASYIRWNFSTDRYGIDEAEYGTPYAGERKQLAQIGDPRAHSPGWHIDKALIKDQGWFEDSSAGKGGQPAQLWDAPARAAGDVGGGWEFFTAAVGRKGKNWEFLGGVKWGFFIRSNGDVVPLSFRFSDQPPDGLGDAIGRWNALAPNRKLPDIEGVRVRYDESALIEKVPGAHTAGAMASEYFQWYMSTMGPSGFWFP